MGWRMAFVVFGIPSVVMGLALLFLGERSYLNVRNRSQKKTKMKANLRAYAACLKNRNIVFTSWSLWWAPRGVEPE